MRKLLQSLLITISFFALTGCGTSESKPTTNVTGGVGVIDLDEVARRLGRDKEMKNAVSQHQQSMNQQIAQVKSSLEQQIVEKRDELGTELSKEQAAAVLNMQQQANLQLNQVRQKAQGTINQQASQLVERFREETRAIARQVANDQGLALVVTKNETVVFAFNSAVDITNEVADRMLLDASSRTESKPVASTALATQNAQR